MNAGQASLPYSFHNRVTMENYIPSSSTRPPLATRLLLSLLLLLLLFVVPQASSFGPAVVDVTTAARQRNCQRSGCEPKNLSATRSTSSDAPALTNQRNAKLVVGHEPISPPRRQHHQNQDTTTTTASIGRHGTTLLLILSAVYSTTLFFAGATTTTAMPAWAAPPMAVIAEELGYFPVQSRDGTLTYIPQRVRRESTEQAVRLADYLHSNHVVLAGTYWCPHTSRQKELLGRQAFAGLDYVECAPQGYQANPKLCVQYKVEGYPTWIVNNDDGSTKQLAGERSLAEVAKFAGYSGSFNEEQEQANPPPPIGGSACK